MATYRNVSGDDRVLMVNAQSGVVVLNGETVEVTDEGAIAGLVGQESVWEPVPDAPARSSSSRKG